MHARMSIPLNRHCLNRYAALVFIVTIYTCTASGFFNYDVHNDATAQGGAIADTGAFSDVLEPMMPINAHVAATAALFSTSDAHPAQRTHIKTPEDVMVDISNTFAFSVLNVHTANKEQPDEKMHSNFVFSPCGLTSVLVALYEASNGQSAYELYNVVRLPWDRDVVRIGLRDIHRRLRLYFYNGNNLLDGLTLNREHVLVRYDYETVLRFYGYDLNVHAMTFAVNKTVPTEMPPKTPGIDVVLMVTTPPTRDYTTTTGTNHPTQTTKYIGHTSDGDFESTTTLKYPDETTLDPKLFAGVTTPYTIETTVQNIESMVSSITQHSQEEPSVTLQPSPLESTIKQETTTKKDHSPETAIKKELNPPLAHSTTPYTLQTTSQQQNTPTTPYGELITQGVSTEYTIDVTETISPQNTPSEVTQQYQEVFTTRPDQSVSFESPMELNTSHGLSEESKTYKMDVTTETIFPTTSMQMQYDQSTESNIILTDTHHKSTITVELSTVEDTIQYDYTTEIKPFDTFDGLIPRKDIDEFTPSDVQQATPFSSIPSTIEIPEMITTLDSPMQSIGTMQNSNSSTGDVTLITETYSSHTNSTDRIKVTYDESTTDIFPSRLITLNTMPPAMQNNNEQEIINKSEQFIAMSKSRGIENDSSVELKTTPDTIRPLRKNRKLTQGTLKQNPILETFVPLNQSIYLNDFTTTRYMNGHKHVIRKKISKRSYFHLPYSDYPIESLIDTFTEYKANPVRIKKPDRMLEENSHQKPFHVSRKDTFDVPCKIFTTFLRLGYVPSIKAAVLELPLDSDKYVLLLVLPDQPFHLNGVMRRMTTRVAPTIRDIRAGMRQFWITATVPDFYLKGNAVLTSDLMKLGIKSIFEPSFADFSPMTDETGIYAKHIEQMVTMNIRTNPSNLLRRNISNDPSYKPIEVSVQQPFIFCVVDQETDLIIMMGQIVNPLNSRVL